jgi:methylglutaconyl-CoA hydratase
MDKGIETLSQILASSNPEAMEMLKKEMWKGTENWDQLLI